MDFSNEKFDIIIQGGQSNAEGTGRGPVDTEFCPSSNVFYLQANKTVKDTGNGLLIEYADEPFEICIANEREKDGEIWGDFSLTFAKAYEEAGLLQNGRKLLIVRAAVGGTGFMKKHWGLQDMLYLKMLELTDYALSLNPENKIVGFLWHQGEHDAFEKNEPNVYKEQLSTMLKEVRARYGKMPFIAGDFCNEWKSKNWEICTPIVDVIRKVVQEAGNAGFVETADLPSNNQKYGNGDDIHFCRQSLRVLGTRYFEAFKNAR